MAFITTMLRELGLPWVMTSYKEKKMSGGLYNSTIKKLCPQSRCGREDKCGLSCCMSPVRTYTWETTAASHSQEQIMARPDGNRYLQEAHQQLTVENTHIRPAWRRKLGLLTPYQLPRKEDRKSFLQFLLGQQSALRGFQGPSQETPCVLTGLRLSTH